jgi:hypothetical protein
VANLNRERAGAFLSFRGFFAAGCSGTVRESTAGDIRLVNAAPRMCRSRARRRTKWGGGPDQALGSPAGGRLVPRRIRQASEPYFTSSHAFSHFFRQTNGRPQTTQSFEGRSDFFFILGMDAT